MDASILDAYALPFVTQDLVRPLSSNCATASTVVFNADQTAALGVNGQLAFSAASFAHLDLAAGDFTVALKMAASSAGLNPYWQMTLNPDTSITWVYQNTEMAFVVDWTNSRIRVRQGGANDSASNVNGLTREDYFDQIIYCVLTFPASLIPTCSFYNDSFELLVSTTATTPIDLSTATHPFGAGVITNGATVYALLAAPGTGLDAAALTSWLDSKPRLYPNLTQDRLLYRNAVGDIVSSSLGETAAGYVATLTEEVQPALDGIREDLDWKLRYEPVSGYTVFRPLSTNGTLVDRRNTGDTMPTFDDENSQVQLYENTMLLVNTEPLDLVGVAEWSVMTKCRVTYVSGDASLTLGYDGWPQQLQGTFLSNGGNWTSYSYRMVMYNDLHSSNPSSNGIMNLRAALGSEVPGEPNQDAQNDLHTVYDGAYDLYVVVRRNSDATYTSEMYVEGVQTPWASFTTTTTYTHSGTNTHYFGASVASGATALIGPFVYQEGLTLSVDNYKRAVWPDPAVNGEQLPPNSFLVTNFDRSEIVGVPAAEFATGRTFIGYTIADGDNITTSQLGGATPVINAKYAEHTIPFGKTFSGIPRVSVTPSTLQTPNYILNWNIISTTTSQFTVRIFDLGPNGTNNTSLEWIAIYVP